ncbi:MAG TPA: polyprenyl synthetase family protein [Treponemataceae bacterium]|nr:polyprenyl synthetase family protein [Treponemataceae bacterium]
MNTQYTARFDKIEDVLHSNLPKNLSKAWILNSFEKIPSAIKQKHIEELTLPCQRLLELGGKRWRPLMLILCAEMVLYHNNEKPQNNPKIDFAYSLVPLVEYVHTASLIHDDIEDGADMRRGQPAAHCVYGIDTAINAASWLYFEAFSTIKNIKNIKNTPIQNQLYTILSTEIRKLHLGQAMDISWHKNTEIPTAEEYTAMVRMKTGTLASLAAKIGIITGGGTIEQAHRVASITADIGVGFQIIDDCINLTTGNKGKKRGDDIVEGKKSLPLLLHVQKKPSDFKNIINCFNQAAAEGISSPAVEECIGIINTSDAIKKAQVTGIDMITKSCAKLKKMYPVKKGGDKEDAPAYLIEAFFTDMLRNI